MSLPVVKLEGTLRAQGEQHGRELRDRVARNVEVYVDRFEREAGLPKSEVLARARAYGESIERESPEYTDGMKGVSSGSGVLLDEIVALNVRYEILYCEFGLEDLRDGCTAYAIAPERTREGHLLMGQNWDWIPEVEGAILHAIDPDGTETIAFTEAGIVGGKIGVSSRGLGLAVNGMTSIGDDWSRLAKPYHVRCHEILRAPDLEAAVRVVTNVPRSCSTNYLIAQAPSSVADVEAAPDATRVLEWEDGRLVHTNHFLDPDALGIEVAESDRLPRSEHRLCRLKALLASRDRVSTGDLVDFLRDHAGRPHSVCRHRDPEVDAIEHYATVTSVIMDLDERRMLFTDGPPCGAEYQEVRLTR
jgi:isopenicillin-N N-acyltransferase-like protein